jgi:hypothetical protein
MAKALTISRRLSGPWWDGVKRHAGQAGQIMWGWNFLQAGFFQIFHQVASPNNHKLALTLWHTIQSDKAQREMALAAAAAVLPEGSKVLADIDWLVKRAQDLSPFRNDSAHVGISLGGDWDEKGRFRMMVYPDEKSARPAAVDRLKAKPMEAYWRTVKGDLWVLGRFATSVAGRVANDPSYGPSLRRPRLLSLPPKRKRAPQKSHPRTKGAS